MPGFANKYDVYDTETNTYILKGVNAGLIEQTIGLGRVNASKYATRGVLFKKRYRIYSKTQPVKSVIRRSKEMQKLMEEWDRVRLLLNPKARR